VRQSHRYRGSILGLAAGDALGAPLEFSDPETLTPVSDMIGGGPHGLPPGSWTDDTSMALCLAVSLIEAGFDPRDQARRYLRWYRRGYLSSTGECFDIGNTTRAALEHFETTGEPFAGSTDPRAAGNGSIMRLAPVPLCYARDARRAIHLAAESSRVTHGTREALDACRYLAALILGALGGAPRETLLSEGYTPVPGLWEEQPLAPAIAAVAAGSFHRREPPEIQGSGYVVRSLEAALWAFATTDSFREGCLRAVNLGDDADTTGAVYGQLAGAYYGVDAIPAEWIERLYWRTFLESVAEELLRCAVEDCAPAREEDIADNIE